jgi:hypothetical protein
MLVTLCCMGLQHQFFHNQPTKQNTLRKLIKEQLADEE